MFRALVLFCLVLNNSASIKAGYHNFGKDHENGFFDKTNFTTYIGDIIFAHTESEIIMHFDRRNWNLVEKIMQNVNSRIMKSVKLICYEDGIETGDLFERPLVQKILNVIVLQDMESFSWFLNTTENVNEQDEALFVLTTLHTGLDFLRSNHQLEVFGKVLVIYVTSEFEVKITSMCYFCGRSSKRLVEIASSNVQAVKSKLYFDKKFFENFEKHIFKVAFTEYFPFIWCVESEEKLIENRAVTVCTKSKGSEHDLIEMMASRLNFTFILIMYPNYAPLMHDLADAKVDFVIGGISATSERAERSTFTRQYWFEGYYFLYIHDTNLRRELGRVLDPFDGSLWLLLVTSVFVTSIVLYALDRVESIGMMSISCQDSLWVCIYMAIEQNANIKQVFRVRTGPAVLLVAWILVCLNLSTAYKSKLSALVMNPPHSEPSDIKELVYSDYKFVVNERYRDVFLALLYNTTDSVVQTALSLTEARHGLCEEFLYALEERAAILDEYTSLQYELRQTCQGELRAKRLETTDSDGTTKIRIARTSLRTIGQVWLLQKRAAYRTGFDKVLGEIVEAGLVEMWMRVYTKHMRRGSFPESHNSVKTHQHNPLSIKLLLSLFLMYGLGNCFAVAVFMVEAMCCKKPFDPTPRRESFTNLKRRNGCVESAPVYVRD